MRFGWKLVELRDSLIQDKFVRVKDGGEPTHSGHLKAMLRNLDWSKVWQEAEMGSVCQYLRGSRSLQLPDEIRMLLPKEI